MLPRRDQGDEAAVEVMAQTQSRTGTKAQSTLWPARAVILRSVLCDEESHPCCRVAITATKPQLK
jgi:hypothetical protein